VFLSDRVPAGDRLGSRSTTPPPRDEIANIEVAV